MAGTSFKFRFFVYVLTAFGSLSVVLFGYYLCYRYPYWSMRAFRATSNSMCPTICKGERVIVKIDPDIAYHPATGDVIVMDYDGQSRLMKRVIGLPGDTVDPGSGETISVNGTLWQAPPICGHSLFKRSTGTPISSMINSEAMRVPAEEYFVIGDNLQNSLDSRIKGFGMIPSSRILGKVLMIYYSPEPSRIGCIVK
jgi:signal peptidase I